MTAVKTQTPWDFGRDLRQKLQDLTEMPEEQLDSIVGVALGSVRDYSESRKDIRKTYARIIRTAERAINHIDSGYGIYSNDDLGSDRDRLVTLHAECARYQSQIHHVMSLICATTGLSAGFINHFDYIGEKD